MARSWKEENPETYKKWLISYQLTKLRRRRHLVKGEEREIIERKIQELQSKS